MGLMCKIRGHKWNFCKCERCGMTRDAEHIWKRTGGKTCIETCKQCGKKRDAHSFIKKTACLSICNVCGEGEISHCVGKIIKKDYDSSSDLFYTDYNCTRCGRKFRNYYAYGKILPGEIVTLGEACIIDEGDKKDLLRQKGI